MKYIKNLTAEKISYFFFWLFLVSFTFSIRKLFYYKNSFATGMFSEFTSVFFEISEVFLAICFLFFGIYLINNQKKIKINKKIKKILLMFFVFLLSAEISVIFALDKPLAFLDILKFIELLGIIIFVYASNISSTRIIKVLFLIAIYQGFIGIMQFYLGKSIGLGLIGEQQMSINLTGSPKINFQETSFLRATGTFLHPNILSCFLLIVFFLSANLQKAWKILRWLLIIPIMLTFSRIGILALFVGLLFGSNKIKNIIVFFLVFSAILIVGFLMYPEIINLIISRINIDTSFVERWQFVKTSLMLLIKHPFGVGGGNFILFMSSISSFSYPWQFQPVHNIFLLSGNEYGIISGVILLIIIGTLLVKYKKYSPIIMVIIIFGMFDHFLITIHSGIAILALIIGIILKSDKVVILDKLKSVFVKN